MDGDSDFEYGDEQYGDPNPTRVSQPGRAKLVANQPHDEEIALSDSGDSLLVRKRCSYTHSHRSPLILPDMQHISST